jgi:hypothetical protein
LQNISFENVDFEFPGGSGTVPMAPAEPGNGYPECNMFGALAASAYYFRHVDGLSFTNCHTTLSAADARPQNAFVDVTRLSGAPQRPRMEKSVGTFLIDYMPVTSSIATP